MVDIETGQGVACNPDGVFYSASTIKGCYVASLAELHSWAVPGWSSTMQQTIRVSSNEGYANLREAFGPATMWTWCAEAGVNANMAATWYPYYSARDLVKLWSRNYQFFTSGSYGWSVGQWYTSSWCSKINQNLGPWHTTMTKPGWHYLSGYKATNDAGIVWDGNRPYLVAIMTNMPSDFDGLNSLVWAIERAHNEMA